jgi:hypothetical protein
MLDRSDERTERVPFSLDAERADDSKLTTDDDRVIQVFIEKVRRARSKPSRGEAVLSWQSLSHFERHLSDRSGHAKITRRGRILSAKPTSLYLGRLPLVDHQAGSSLSPAVK